MSARLLPSRGRFAQQSGAVESVSVKMPARFPALQCPNRATGVERDHGRAHPKWAHRGAGGAVQCAKMAHRHDAKGHCVHALALQSRIRGPIKRRLLFRHDIQNIIHCRLNEAGCASRNIIQRDVCIWFAQFIEG